MLKDFQGALVDLNRAIELEPSVIYARINRAVTLMNLTEWERALIDLDMYITHEVFEFRLSRPDTAAPRLAGLRHARSRARQAGTH
jgi:hypothetical protein